MPDPKQLPYLLNLLEDESEMVHGSVVKELKAFGSSLIEELTRLSPEPSPKQKQILEQLFEDQAMESLKTQWPSWFELNQDKKRLETALGILAEFLSGISYKENLSAFLDRLAEEYRSQYSVSEPRTLAQFLFEHKGISGAQADYYNPDNSNLIYVIECKKGIPISLVSIYILVGARLGLAIEGCNLPGHFLAKVRQDEKIILIDCFSGGRIVEKEDILRLNPKFRGSIRDLLEEEVDAEVIIRRFLNNLVTAYLKKEEWRRSQLMSDILEELRRFSPPELRLSNWDIKKLSREPGFRMGQVVKHKRYGYRGVIVEFDFSCQADDDWYFSNQTQPKKNQPWYYVLVDKSSRVTYVAESFLAADDKKEIRHPLIEQFFTKTENGVYQRNHRPWPRT